jgi:PEP-CTERM motif
MKYWICGAVAAVAMVSSVPVAAVTFSFGGGTVSGTTLPSLAVVNGAVTLTATARQFTALPGSLTQLSQTLATGSLTQTVPGIGVAGGADSAQIDTNIPSAREAILISGSRTFSLNALQLSSIDNDDTLQVYGVNSNGSLVNLGYAGVIRNGLTGPNAALSLLNGAATGPAFQSTLSGGTQALTLVNPTAAFSSYLFTTREPGEGGFLGGSGQGYRIDSLVVGVPEPENWALLIAGFGLIGVAARRRRTAVAA